MNNNDLLSIIRIAAKSKQKSLDLRGYDLEELPPEIGALTNIQKIKLSKNKLTKLPAEVGNLKNLTHLDISLNRISELPSELGNATNLKWLEISHNQLTELPPELGHLIRLNWLDVSCNQLCLVPPELGNLTNLWRLNLHQNQLTEVPKELCHLQRLTWLYLSHNKLKVIPKELCSLKQLIKFQLCSNELTSLPASLGNLNKLEDFDVSQNLLKGLPQDLQSLSKLEKLQASQNNISELPADFGNLISLKEVDLSCNQIETIPAGLRNLINLNKIDLSRNKLIEIPLELGRLSHLSYIDLSENPKLSSPPPEVITQGMHAVLSYLREHTIQGEQQWVSKLLIVGEGGVGKTSLLRALRREKFQEQQSTTRGISISQFKIPHPNKTDISMTLNAWDFGGQEIYHATHQFFLTNRSLFLLVFNARLGYEQGKLFYWLKTIRANAPESPILIVSTWADERASDVPFTELKDQFPQIVGELHEVSNKVGYGIDELKSEIIRVAADLPLMGEEWPKTWLDFAKVIRQAKANYTVPRKIWNVMSQYGVSDDGKLVLITWLHELGDILFFKDNPNLNQLVILKPQWVTTYISKVLESEQVLNQLGIFTRQCMEELWQDLNSNLHNHFLEMMEQFDLSYKIPEDSEDKSLVVECLAHDPPDYQELWKAKKEENNCKEISMTFQLSEILAGIPTWFIARQHRFTLGLHWRTGVLFGDNRENPRHLGLLRVERDTLSNADFVRLSVRGPMPHSFFDVLREGFELTLRRYPGLKITRRIPCSDPKKIGCEGNFDYADLVRRLERNPPKEAIECSKCMEDISVTQLLFGIHYTTQDKVIERINQLEKDLESSLQDGFQELRELVQREFFRSFRRAQNFPESYCPNLFAIRTDDRSFWEKGIGSKRVYLQLYCQYPGEVHPICDPHNPPKKKDSSQGCYTIDTPYKWLQTMAPYIRHMINVFKYAAPLISPALGIAVPNLDAQIKADIDLMNELVKKFPDVISTDENVIGETKPGYKESHSQRLIGTSLRNLRSFLDHEDPEHCWGNLNRVLTPEGDYLWLCEHHQKIIFPK